MSMLDEEYRDSMLDFSLKLGQSGHNVKAYRNRNRKSKAKNNAMNMHAATSVVSSVDKLTHFIRNKESTELPSKRLSVTASNTRRGQDVRSINKTVNTKVSFAKILDESQLEIPSNINPKFFDNSNQFIKSETTRNKFAFLEKKINRKGPLKDKYIENWLNLILIEYCHEQKFDPNTDHAALKKLSIDHNSLLSKGLSQQHLQRVYRCMFVYSIGFNNLLKQLTNKDNNLRKTIWKVYAILLEYCAEGSFETMIGEIERDKSSKLELLKEEIQKRQRIIQNNDESNEEKNAKIYKELKVLREENEKLENQKNILAEEFKEAEQAFNQEVSLRLKFQNKINEIHGVYRELNSKHTRLYQDFMQKTQQNKVLLEKANKNGETARKYRLELERKTSELITLQKEHAFNQELVVKLKSSKKELESTQIQKKNHQESLQTILKEKDRRLSQMGSELQNGQVIITMKTESHQQLEAEYYNSLTENKKLQQTVREQIDQIGKLMKEKKDFNEKHLSIISECQISHRTIQAQKQHIQQLGHSIEDVKQELSKERLEKECVVKQNQRLQKNLDGCYDNITQMKILKDKMEEELIYLQKKDNAHERVVSEKLAMIEELQVIKEELGIDNDTLKGTNKALESKARLAQEKLFSEKELNKKRLQKMMDEKEELRKVLANHSPQLQLNKNELEKYTILYNEAVQLHKNERFERTNLQLRFHQTLQIVESHNDHIKQLNIQLSEFREENEELVRKARSAEYLLGENQRKFQRQKAFMQSRLDETKAKHDHMKEYVNPMLFEDLSSRLVRLSENHQQLLEKYQKQTSHFKSMLEKMEKEGKHVTETKDALITEMEAKYEKEIQTKIYELEYEREKREHQKKILDEIEKRELEDDILDDLHQEGRVSAPRGDLQRKYLATIADKQAKVDSLLKEVEKIQDLNNDLRGRMNEAEDKLKKQSQSEQSNRNQNNHHINQNNQSHNSPKKANHSKESVDAHETSNKNEKSQEDPKDFNEGNSNIVREQQRSRKSSHSKSSVVDSKGINPSSAQKNDRNERSNNPKWRNDFARKVKHAVTYYRQ